MQTDSSLAEVKAEGSFLKHISAEAKVEGNFLQHVSET